MMRQLLAIFLILSGGAWGLAGTAIAAGEGPETPPQVDPCYQPSADEALEACDRALSIAPEDPSLWTIRGAILHEKLQRTAEALESHDRAIALAPEYSLALYNRCVVLIALERYLEAWESCDRALQGDGQWGQATPAQAYMNQGVALRRLRRYTEALEAYDRALQFQPDYALAWNNRGVVLLELGRNADAEAAFERAIAIDPDHDLARRNLAIVKQRQQYP